MSSPRNSPRTAPRTAPRNHPKPDLVDPFDLPEDREDGSAGDPAESVRLAAEVPADEERARHAAG